MAILSATMRSMRLHWAVRPCRQEKGGISALNRLDRAPGVATIPRLPKRAASESPCNRPQRSSLRLDRNPVSSLVLRPRGWTRGLFYAASEGLVFENSAACVYVETSDVRGVGPTPWHGSRNQPVMSRFGLRPLDGQTLSASSK